MPRYYFHYYNSEVLCDEVGQELPDLAAADSVARRTAGELISEHVARDEKVDLSHRIDVESDNRIVIVLKFRDLFTGHEG